MTIRTRRVAGLCLALAVLALAPVLCAPVLGAQQSALEQKLNADEEGLKALHAWHDIQPAMVRLPLAALLGAALALRPRRRGTPKRTPAVVQTQIVLAVVGAVNLIRYRSKIDDPKDAVVMLCALAVGLASGVGLYALGVFSTAFLVAALWVIESFEPQGLKRFDLKIKAGKDTDALRPALEAILKRYDLDFELRTSSDDEVCYDVQVPLELQTDRVSNAILKLDPEGHGAVEWAEKKNKVK